ncbi:Uncharacterized protein APZ42_011917, partial [Daphnia magna]
MAVVFPTSLMKLVLVKLVITEHSYSIVQLLTIYHILSNFLLEPRNFKKPLGLGEFTEVMHKEGALCRVEVIGRWFHLENDAEIVAAQEVEYFNKISDIFDQFIFNGAGASSSEMDVEPLPPPPPNQ